MTCISHRHIPAAVARRRLCASRRATSSWFSPSTPIASCAGTRRSACSSPKNTANERLKRLHQHGYLARRRLPVEYGLGSRQALYLLARRGAQLVAQREGLDVAEGWKDTVLLMPGERVRLLLRFEDFTGLYLYHCHNLEHEDQGFMRNYRITAPSTASAFQAPVSGSI
jgi:hypothetical protein